MRLWKRISRVASDVSSRLAWQKLGRRKLKTANDPETALLRELTTKGTPMSLATIKAALDATTSAHESKRSGSIIDRMESLRFPTIADPDAKFV